MRCPRLTRRRRPVPLRRSERRSRMPRCPWWWTRTDPPTPTRAAPPPRKWIQVSKCPSCRPSSSRIWEQEGMQRPPVQRRRQQPAMEEEEEEVHLEQTFQMSCAAIRTSPCANSSTARRSWACSSRCRSAAAAASARPRAGRGCRRSCSTTSRRDASGRSCRSRTATRAPSCVTSSCWRNTIATGISCSEPMPRPMPPSTRRQCASDSTPSITGTAGIGRQPKLCLGLWFRPRLGL